MGTSPLTLKMLFEDLGHEVIMPPRPTSRTLSLGTKYAPEFGCLPMKIVLGTYLEVLEQGAEILVTSGGCGPCRAGHYAQLHREILLDLGFSFELVVIELPRRGLLDFLGKIRRLNEKGLSWWGIWKIIKKAWAHLNALDELESVSHYVRPRELVKGATDRAYRLAMSLMEKARTPGEIEEARRQGLEALRGVPQDPSRRPLKVGLVGEIYVVLEPFANLQIERVLGEMGVEVHRSIYLTGWTEENAVADTAGRIGGMDIKLAAEPYLPEMIGGHGQDSVGHTILYARHGFDGVIQLAPFSCIPEIVARSILPAVSRELDIPVLTFFLDEMTGEAGFRTRLEAFVDLLARRRALREAAAAEVLG